MTICVRRLSGRRTFGHAREVSHFLLQPGPRERAPEADAHGAGGGYDDGEGRRGHDVSGQGRIQRSHHDGAESEKVGKEGRGSGREPMVATGHLPDTIINGTSNLSMG